MRIAVNKGLPALEGPDEAQRRKGEDRMKEVLTNRLARLLCVKSLHLGRKLFEGRSGFSAAPGGILGEYAAYGSVR